MGIYELGKFQLKKYWDPAKLPFKSTKDLQPLNGIIGQERAVKAMEFGTKINRTGYNIYISGISGTGKTTYARDYISMIAKKQQIPDDWCYVYNFENPSQPTAISLPHGMGKIFTKDIKKLIIDVREEIVKAFRGEDYEKQKTEILKKIQDKRNIIFQEFDGYAKEQGFKVNAGNSGIYFTPIIDGKELNEDEYDELDDNTKKVINNKLNDIQIQAVDFLRKMKDLEKDASIGWRKLENEIGLFAVRLHVDEIKDKYNEFPKVLKYLDALEEDILSNLDDFKEDDENDNEQQTFTKLLHNQQKKIPNKYSVNLLVDNSKVDGAPVIVEYNPTFNNLFGTIEYENKLGTLVTDFSMIKPGSIHIGNGGYLILQVKDILSTSYIWENLKKILKTKSISIENLRDQFGLFGTSTLKPDPIPIDIKIVLIGSEYIFQLLYQFDEDFQKLFKIKVDFDDEMEANEHNLIDIAQFISGFCERERSRHFTKKAVIKVAEYSSRLVENQQKFSTRFNEIVEIIAEADTWAQIEGMDIITAHDVSRAIHEKLYRSSKYDKKLLEILQDGTIMVDIDGEEIGQINGLAVMNMGNFTFGKPSRITANTYIGKNGIVNIEREVSMSGNTHSKGVMILEGYIGRKYAQNIPLTLSASITFEQLYSGIDGDSASSTELYAILSSLAEVPIKQGIAVTGSVNQKGEIQPVGGVTYKIEGFFDLCKTMGLTGEQGVIIPFQNIKNLTLKDEVIEAVDKGLFHIYAVKTIDDGIEILTGIPAGKKLNDGTFEAGTIHEMVYNKLKSYAITMFNFGKENEKGRHTNE
ncbi:Lon protease family protein [Xylanivirga thermophila]|uniref:Lon protease family protein n=1 Tax=Xylanivirga thermophila TaxID=2496273 RepID=UPI00101BD2B3|nr:ATP-binding protein [Xylanivirga thermophila]